MPDVTRIAPEWQQTFQKFVSTGEGVSPEFVRYLENDLGAQAAVEEIFTAQAKNFEALGAELKRSENKAPRRSILQRLGS